MAVHLPILTAMSIPVPNIEEGIEYWADQPASLDGVLGGYGTGSLPRIDALGSRQFLLSLRPDLCTVPSSLRSQDKIDSDKTRPRTRGLDVGAGIGRVTKDVLLPLLDDVVLLEPVKSLVDQAVAAGRASASSETSEKGQKWKGIEEKTKSVVILQGTLQAFDPSNIITVSPSSQSDTDTKSVKLLDRVGYAPTTDSPTSDLVERFDVIWCQWCLGHLSDVDIVPFFRQCKAALRDTKDALIVVKENLCSDPADGGARTVFDEQDSSLTRSDMAWKEAFTAAGLQLIDERVQEGLPEGLYVVKAYALR